MINITLPETPVNTEYLTPYSFGSKSIIKLDRNNGFHDDTLTALTINGRKITVRVSSVFNHIIYRIWRNNGTDKQIPHDDFINHMRCCRQTAGNVIKQLEDYGWITVNRMTVSIDGQVRTYNTYNINWKIAYEDLGDLIFGKSSGGKYNFIQGQIDSLKKRLKRLKDESVNKITTAFETCVKFFNTPTSSLSLRDKDNNTDIQNLDFLGTDLEGRDRYHWRKDIPIKKDWIHCVKIHGILNEYVPQIYQKFGNFYTQTAKNVMATDQRWKEHWINWLETTMRFESADRFLKPPRSNADINPPKQLPVNEVQEDRFRGIDDLPPHIQSKLSDIRSYMGDASFLSYIWSHEPLIAMFDIHLGIVFPENKKWMRDRILRDTGHINYFDSIGVKLL